jgi:hypothetical protein
MKMSKATLLPEGLVESRCVRFFVPGDVNEGSPNKRLHWRQRAELDQRWKEKAALLWRASQEGAFPDRVEISFVVYRGREMDYCNVLGSRCLKALIDGLKGRAFKDDSPRYLRWGTVRQVTGKPYKAHPCVEVILQEITYAD